MFGYVPRSPSISNARLYPSEILVSAIFHRSIVQTSGNNRSFRPFWNKVVQCSKYKIFLGKKLKKFLQSISYRYLLTLNNVINIRYLNFCHSPHKSVYNLLLIKDCAKGDNWNMQLQLYFNMEFKSVVQDPIYFFALVKLNASNLLF